MTWICNGKLCMVTLLGTSLSPSHTHTGQVDTGFVVWSFQGRLLYRNPNKFEKICQFLWRPRPPTLLTEADLKVSGGTV